MNKVLRIVVVIALSLAIMAFLMRNEPQMPYALGIAAIVFAAIFGIQSSPRTLQFIRRNSRRLAVGGVTFIAVGIAGVVAFVFLFPGAGSEYTAGALVGILLVGSFILSLPRIMKNAQQVPAPRPLANADQSFDGLREGIVANGFILANFGAFLRAAMGWVVVGFILPLLGLMALAYRNGVITSFASPLSKANAAPRYEGGALIFALILLWLCLPAIAIAWHRFVLELRRPVLLPLPGKGYGRYLWRIWSANILLGAMNKFLDKNAPDLSRALHLANAAQAQEFISWAVVIIFVLVAASLSLVLPAIAVNNQAMTATASVLATKRLGAFYRTGLVVAAAPFFLIVLLLMHILDSEMSKAPSIALLLCYALPLLAGLASALAAVTYISRSYQAALAASGMQIAAPSAIVG